MNAGLSDHQLIYYTRKISRVKTEGVHKKIKFRSLKNYAVDAYKNALEKTANILKMLIARIQTSSKN